MEFSTIKASVHFLCSVLPINQGLYRFDDATIETTASLAREIKRSHDILSKREKEVYATNISWVDTIELFNQKIDEAGKQCPVTTENHGLSFNGLFPDMYPMMLTILGSACSFQMVCEYYNHGVLICGLSSGR